MGSLQEMPGNDDFEPKRLLVNFELIQPEESNEDLTNFDLAIGLQVYFTHKDFEFESEEKPLALAFWDSNKRKWVLFKEAKDTVKKVLIEDDPIWAGYFEIEFDEWGDPPMALGN